MNIKNSILALVSTMSLVACGSQPVSSTLSSERSTAKARGYLTSVKHGSRSTTAFLGLSADMKQAQFGYDDYFDGAQKKAAEACMRMPRQEYAVEVLTVTNPVKVPSDIPGRSVTVHAPEVLRVACVKAPGFIKIWRDFFGAVGN